MLRCKFAKQNNKKSSAVIEINVQSKLIRQPLRSSALANFRVKFGFVGRGRPKSYRLV